MKLLTFNGERHSYARFKKDFNEIAMPFIPNETQLIFNLKGTCLKGEPKKKVANITVISEIWERLDLKYSDIIEIVNMK